MRPPDAGPAGALPAGTSTLTTRLVLRVVVDRLGEAAVDTMLTAAGLGGQRERLESRTGRVDYGTKIRVFAAAAEALADPRFGLQLGSVMLADPTFAGLRSLVRAADSPERALRFVSRASTRFDTAAVFRCEDARPKAATVAKRVLPPHEPHRVNCDYSIGILRQVPVLFGLPPAVVHHPACQVDGAPECRYEMEWQRVRIVSRVGTWWRARAGRRDRREPVDAGRYEGRLAALQAAAADVIGGGCVEEVLDRIAARADSALHAPGHVLAVTLPSGREHIRLLGAGTHLEGAVRCLQDLPPGLHVVAGLPVATAAVASAARHYGVLAAVALPGQEFFPQDADTLAAYAQHAAASLEMSSHLADAAREAHTAQLLLEAARSLSRHRTVASVAESVAAAVPPLTGAGRSAFALVDSDTGSASIAGRSQWPLHLAGKVVRYVTDPHQSPELEGMLHSRAPVLLDATSSPWARAMLADFEIQAMAAVPVVLDEKVLGLVLAHWVTGAPHRLDDVLTERLTGLAGLAAVALDNTRLLEQVQRQALHDALTGLPNRLLLEERLEEALEGARAVGGRVGLLFCDVNRFKRVNDSLGHEAGDQLLRRVAAVLRSSVRDEDTVARYSGDEFVVLLPRIRSEGEVRDVVARIRAQLTEPITVAGEPVFVNLAIGSAVSDGWTTAESRPVSAAGLVATADRSMYELKARTRGLPTRAGASVDRLRLETDLHGAVDRGELVVHYQPQIDVRTGATVAVEALVRWLHPEFGLIHPAVFVPIAEESGAIDDIGAHVLREACRTVAGWHVGGYQVEVSVNVSAAQLHSPAFSDLVLAVLLESGLAPQRLVLEVTESQVVADASSDTHLRALRELGVCVSIDDFGTGYSSLARLRRLPATEVKIDQSFTAELPTSAAFIAGIIALAHGLDLRVVAEGVEHPAQLQALWEAGCDRAQGYLIGQPTVATDLRLPTQHAATSAAGGGSPMGDRSGLGLDAIRRVGGLGVGPRPPGRIDR